MSEYQFIAFRAVDAPVSAKNLAFMRRQSSRATITSWSFENEYNFGDFHGDEAEMLRRGYDFHLHYANFGVRKLMFRLPGGLPDVSTATPYFQDESLAFLKDKQGAGGILCIDPFYEAGELEELWEFEAWIDRLLPLRAEILAGDLRPLYLGWLAVASDGNHDPQEQPDAPLPAGLDQLTDAQRALAGWYGLSAALIEAAARNSPPMPEREDSQQRQADWLRRQPEETKTAWLGKLMADSGAAVRSEILAEFSKSSTAACWPTVRVDRTLADLRASAEEIQQEKNHRRKEDTARRRAVKLAEMAADPAPTLRKTEELVNQHNIEAYHRVGKLLADLREALAGTSQANLAEQHARRLKERNPTRRHLTAALRSQGFVKKESP